MRQKWTGQDLANLLFAAGKLGCAPMAVLAVLLPAAQARLEELTPAQASSLGCSLARLQEKAVPPEQLSPQCEVHNEQRRFAHFGAN